MHTWYFHAVGAAAIVLDILGLWWVGHKTSMTMRRIGMACMSGVNGLFAVQSVLDGINWTLLWVSAFSCLMQVRAVINWSLVNETHHCGIEASQKPRSH